MAVKKLVTVSDDPPAELDQLTPEERDQRDIKIINRHADRLNSEAEDSAGYQQIW